MPSTQPINGFFPPINDMSSGVSYMDDRVLLFIFYASPFALLIPSDNSIGFLLASASRTWNIFPHRYRVYVDIGILSNPLILEAVYPINTFWKNYEYERGGGGCGSITTHSPSFPDGIYSPETLARLCEAVLYLSTKDMHNLDPPVTAPPHIPLPHPYIKRIWNRGPVFVPSAGFIIILLTILLESPLCAIPLPNSIYEEESAPRLDKYQAASYMLSPINSSLPQPLPTSKLNLSETFPLPGTNRKNELSHLQTPPELPTLMVSQSYVTIEPVKKTSKAVTA